MLDFDKQTKEGLIRDSIKHFIKDYNEMVDKENLPHDKIVIDELILNSLFRLVKEKML